MLARLGERGLLQLPARRRIPARRASRVIETVAVDEGPITGALKSVQPITLEVIAYGTPSAAVFDSLLAQHHYLEPVPDVRNPAIMAPVSLPGSGLGIHTDRPRARNRQNPPYR